MSQEVLFTIIGALCLLLFRDVAGEMLKRLFSGQTLTLTDISALKADVHTLKQKQAEHDGMLIAVTELRSEMRSMREAFNNQPNLIAGVVSETIRATLQFVRAPKAANG